ncbi:hypothetical protein Tco_0144478 [Tanacetum coccineum]
MENANPPPTNNPPVLPTALRAKIVQELNELQAISTYINSYLENIDRFLNGFTQQPNEIDVDDLEPDDESVDTLLVSPFLDSDDDSDEGEVLNELEEYGEFTLSSLDVLQGFSFFLQMGFTLILATLDGLDVGLLGDVIGEDDCDDDG